MRKWNESVIAMRQRSAKGSLAIRFRRGWMIAALVCMTHAGAGTHPSGSNGISAPNNHARAGSGGPASQQQAAEAQAEPATDDSALNYETEEDCE